MRCWYCDKKLGFFHALKKELFCSSEHEELYKREQQELLMERVLGDPDDMPVVMGGPARGPATVTPIDAEASWKALRAIRPGQGSLSADKRPSAAAREDKKPVVPGMADIVPYPIVVRSLASDFVHGEPVPERAQIVADLPRIWLPPLADEPEAERPPVVEEPLILFPELGAEPAGMTCSPCGPIPRDGAALVGRRPQAAIPAPSLGACLRGAYENSAAADDLPRVAIEQSIRRRTLVSALVLPGRPTAFHKVVRTLAADPHKAATAWDTDSLTALLPRIEGMSHPVAAAVAPLIGPGSARTENEVRLPTGAELRALGDGWQVPSESVPRGADEFHELPQFGEKTSDSSVRLAKVTQPVRGPLSACELSTNDKLRGPGWQISDEGANQQLVWKLADSSVRPAQVRQTVRESLAACALSTNDRLQGAAGGWHESVLQQADESRGAIPQLVWKRDDSTARLAQVTHNVTPPATCALAANDKLQGAAGSWLVRDESVLQQGNVSGGAVPHESDIHRGPVVQANAGTLRIPNGSVLPEAAVVERIAAEGNLAPTVETAERQSIQDALLPIRVPQQPWIVKGAAIRDCSALALEWTGSTYCQDKGVTPDLMFAGGSPKAMVGSPHPGAIQSSVPRNFETATFPWALPQSAITSPDTISERIPLVISREPVVKGVVSTGFVARLSTSSSVTRLDVAWHQQEHQPLHLTGALSNPVVLVSTPSAPPPPSRGIPHLDYFNHAAAISNAYNEMAGESEPKLFDEILGGNVAARAPQSRLMEAEPKRFAVASGFARSLSPGSAVAAIIGSDIPETLTPVGSPNSTSLPSIAGQTPRRPAKLSMPDDEVVWREGVDCLQTAVVVPPSIVPASVSASVPPAPTPIAPHFAWQSILPGPQPAMRGDREPELPREVIGEREAPPQPPSSRLVVASVTRRVLGRLPVLHESPGLPFEARGVDSVSKLTARDWSVSTRLGLPLEVVLTAELEHNTLSFNPFVSKATSKAGAWHGEPQSSRLTPEGRIPTVNLAESRRVDPSGGMPRFPRHADRFGRIFDGQVLPSATEPFAKVELGESEAGRVGWVSNTLTMLPPGDVQLRSGGVLPPIFGVRDFATRSGVKTGAVKPRPAFEIVAGASRRHRRLPAKPNSHAFPMKAPVAARPGALWEPLTVPCTQDPSVAGAGVVYGAGLRAQSPSLAPHLMRATQTREPWPTPEKPTERIHAGYQYPAPGASLGRRRALPIKARLEAAEDRVPGPGVPEQPGINASGVRAAGFSMVSWRSGTMDSALVVPLLVYRNGRPHIASGRPVASHPSADATYVSARVTPLPRRRSLNFPALTLVGDAPLDVLMAALQSVP